MTVRKVGTISCLVLLCCGIVLLPWMNITVSRRIDGIILAHQNSNLTSTRLFIGGKGLHSSVYDLFLLDNRILSGSRLGGNLVMVFDAPPGESIRAESECMYNWTTIEELRALRQNGVREGCFASRIEIHAHGETPAGWIF